MKRIKKLVSLILAMAMVLGVSAMAFAADNDSHNISIKQNTEDGASHTYDAYQIFAGDLAPNPDAATAQEHPFILSNVIWGVNVDGEGLLTALKADPTIGSKFANCTTAAQVAAELAKFTDSDTSNATETDTFAKIVNDYLTTTVAGTITGTGDVTISVTGSGYYLVKDRDGSVATGSAYTRFLLRVVGDAEVNVKSTIPGGDKQVYVVGPDGGTFDSGDANYAAIGSHVSYEITSNVPNHTGYDYYYFIMNDTLSKGLTFDGASTVRVTVGGAELTQGTDYYVYTRGENDPETVPTFRLAFANIKNYDVDANIVVTYSATVNAQAAIGTTGNPNTWTLQYSNNPDETYDGTQDNSNPGLPAEDSNVVLGETPEEITLTYLTELDLTKYANEVNAGNELEGAEFTLTGTSYQVVLTNVTYYALPEAGETADTYYYLLKNGTYTTTAPTGTDYVEIGVGTAETTTGYILVDGNYVVPEDRADYVGATLYKLVRGTNEDYVDVNTVYVAKTNTTTTLVPVQVSMELTTNEEGKISFKGLGAGSYTLTETVTPEGFNTMDPISFTIEFEAPEKEVSDGSETCTWKVTNANGITFDEATPTSGIFAANVINKSGSLLPATGGIGTTIFYVLGTVLVLGAGILLVVRKRVSKAD